MFDPCCGTGAYLAEVLRRIATNLQDQGLGALAGARVKRAATERLFGFEIMPAPFVVTHLQVGITMEELDATAYRSTKQVRPPEGQGLNDLYVRFFRMAERRIAEQSGRGVVCFISNYSWLDGLSFTGMRERYLEAFDLIRIDNLHGDRIISEYAPDGQTSETVFALRGQSPGIKVGTSIALLSRFGSASDLEGPSGRVQYRDFDQARADERQRALLGSV